MILNKIIRHIAIFCEVVILFLAVTLLCWQIYRPAEPTVMPSSTSMPPTLLAQLQHQAPQLPSTVLAAGLRAYEYGTIHHEIQNDHLAIADMALPSSQKRLWVFDMQTHKLIYNTYVAHGKGSGALYATNFSNTVNSNATSIGVYRTGQEYIGEHGLSLRLQGLETGFNNHAYERAIVLHAADYVSQSFLNTYHRLGRSLGCPTVSENIVKPLVKTLKNGAMLLIYYPEKNWLHHSKFLQNEA